MENVLPASVKTIYKEIREIQEDKIDGIQLILNDEDISDIQATIDGPIGTPFDGGRFHIRLLLPSNYPSEPPRGYFLTKIFHPNINWRSGDICVDTLKKEWKSDLGIRHILLTIRCLLIAPNPESALNEEAGRLLLEDYEEYTRLAKVYTEIHAPKPENRAQLCAASEASNDAAKVEAPVLRDSNGQSSGRPVRAKPKKKMSTMKKMLMRL
uniref:E2 ubiquitin-conjugating enzyme n=1 Tax=Mesocestoides corti TaxID=53468 RepID=A0A5K3G4G8_MESCO